MLRAMGCGASSKRFESLILRAQTHSSELAAISMTIRRLKTYAGSQGYVYQYYFVGKRTATGGDESDGVEYIFDVTSDRKLTYAVSVLLPHSAVAAWSASHGRSLSNSEQYAAVKMRLFRA